VTASKANKNPAHPVPAKAPTSAASVQSTTAPRAAATIGRAVKARDIPRTLGPSRQGRQSRAFRVFALG
jgi:hypothetical protein